MFKLPFHYINTPPDISMFYYASKARLLCACIYLNVCNKTIFKSKFFFLIDVIDIKSDDKEEKRSLSNIANPTKVKDKNVSGKEIMMK